MILQRRWLLRSQQLSLALEVSRLVKSGFLAAFFLAFSVLAQKTLRASVGKRKSQIIGEF
jgi:hypothetical protein